MRASTPLALLFIAHAGASTVIDTMDAVTITTPAECTASSVAGHLGNAVALAWQANAPSKYAVAGSVAGSAAWDSAAGLSFWVKGDGSTSCGAIEFIWNGDYAQRYAFAFRIDNPLWTQVTMPWSDLRPELSAPANAPLGGAQAPSKLGQMWFGKWWYWRDLAACTYAIDDVRLETSIAVDTTDYTPAGGPLARARAKLMAGQALQVVTMGDSLTDLQHSSNLSHNWPTDFVADALALHGCAVGLDDPAIGGRELRGSVVMIPHWLQSDPQPDLVTIFFGGNDWAAGMRSPTFHDALVDAIRRVRRLTAGHADVLVMTTCPGIANWDVYAELAADARAAAAEENAGLCDIYALYHAIGGSTASRLYTTDGTHLSDEGQHAVATAVRQAIEDDVVVGGTGSGTTTGATTTGGTTTGGTTTSGTTTGGTTTGTSSGGTTTATSSSGAAGHHCGAGAAMAAAGVAALFAGRSRRARG